MAHEHDHGHRHAHDGHSHGVSADADRGKLAIALGLIIAFMAVEVTVGIIASSLALLSDAAHMLTDATAIGLSLVAIRLAQRPARGALTFGLKRTEILSAQLPPLERWRTARPRPPSSSRSGSGGSSGTTKRYNGRYDQ